MTEETFVLGDLEDYQALARYTAIYPAQFTLLYPALGLANEAGEAVGKIKKMMRDETFNPVSLTDEQRDVLAAEMGDVLWYLSALATDAGLSLQDIAAQNIQKLYDRKVRGVLGGSGDNR